MGRREDYIIFLRYTICLHAPEWFSTKRKSSCVVLKIEFWGSWKEWGKKGM